VIKTLSAWCVGLGAVLVACGAPPAETPASNRAVVMTASNPDTVEPQRAGAWSLQAERHLGGRTAHGTAIVIAPDRPDPASSPHARLAGARAWSALGAQYLSAGDATSAAAAARAGLQEIGDGYCPPGVDDDTMLKISAAEERIADGAVADGATGLLRMLDTRIQLYVQNNAPNVR
jgi:hypothetical protein